MPPQSTAAKNWAGGGHVPLRLPRAPMIKPPQISKANFAYDLTSHFFRSYISTAHSLRSQGLCFISLLCVLGHGSKKTR